MPRGKGGPAWSRPGPRVSSLLLATLLLAGALAVGPSILNGPPGTDGSWRVFGSPEAMRGYVSGLGVSAPAAFFVAHVAQVIVAPLPGGVTTVAGPLLFGPWVGTALILAGGVVGSVVLFVSVRRWGRPLAVRIVGQANFERFSGVFHDEKGMVLFVVMLVPLVPDDLAVAVAGLSGVSLRRFALLVALGRLPGWLLTAFVTTELVGRSAATLAAAGLTIAVAATLVLVHRRRLEDWLLRPGRRAPGSDPRE